MAAKTLGPKGRTVRCARCQTDWKAVGEPAGSGISDAQEAQLDAAFATEEQANPESDVSGAQKKQPGAEDQKQAEEAVSNPVAVQNRRADLMRRQNLLKKSMPKPRWHRPARIASLTVFLLLLTGVILFRENLVRWFPQMAGVYQTVGLGVNIVGLEFSDVKTLRTRENGEEVLRISARIHSVSSHQVGVPPILVGVLDEGGQPVFEWSVTSRAAIMLPDEWVEFHTELKSPPRAGVRVRLLFDLAQ